MPLSPPSATSQPSRQSSRQPIPASVKPTIPLPSQPVIYSLYPGSQSSSIQSPIRPSIQPLLSHCFLSIHLASHSSTYPVYPFSQLAITNPMFSCLSNLTMHLSHSRPHHSHPNHLCTPCLPIHLPRSPPMPPPHPSIPPSHSIPCIPPILHSTDPPPLSSSSLLLAIHAFPQYSPQATHASLPPSLAPLPCPARPPTRRHTITSLTHQRGPAHPCTHAPCFLLIELEGASY